MLREILRLLLSAVDLDRSTQRPPSFLYTGSDMSVMGSRRAGLVTSWPKAFFLSGFDYSVVGPSQHAYT